MCCFLFNLLINLGDSIGVFSCAERYLCCLGRILIQFSHSVMSDSLWPHGLQHARFPCPSPTPRACTNLCPWSWWCHPIISLSIVLFSSSLQSFPASGSLPVSQFFTSGGQSIWASASASVLPINIQDWFPLGWTGLISLCPRDSQESSPTPQFKSINPLVLNFLYGRLLHPYMTTGKTMTRWTFVGKVMSLLFNVLSRFVIAFLLKNKRLLISRLRSPSTVILEPKKIKSVTVFIVSTSVGH